MIETKLATPGRSYAGLSLDERKALRRDKFLQAGIEIFGTVGFRGATVRGLCKQAQLTDRYFYQSFGSTEILLTSVYELCMTRVSKNILRSVHDAKEGETTPKLIELALDSFFQELEDPRIARICMLELEGVSPAVTQLYHSYIRGFSSLAIGLSQKFYPNLNISDEERQIIGGALIGAMRQAATQWLLTGYASDRKTLVAVSSTIFMGVLNQVTQQNA